MQTYQTRRKTPGRGAVPGKGQDISKSEMLHLSGAGAPQPMSPALREKFEPGFQADFSNIRISRGHIPEEMGVQAVAQGTDILLDQSAGMDVLGHELAHVVQQAQGRVDGGYPVVENAALEHEADVMGARVASGLTAQVGTQNGFGGEMMSIAPMSSASAPAQCKSREEKKMEKTQISEPTLLQPGTAGYQNSALDTEHLSAARKQGSSSEDVALTQMLNAMHDSEYLAKVTQSTGSTPEEIKAQMGSLVGQNYAKGAKRKGIERGGDAINGVFRENALFNKNLNLLLRGDFTDLAGQMAQNAQSGTMEQRASAAGKRSQAGEMDQNTVDSQFDLVTDALTQSAPAMSVVDGFFREMKQTGANVSDDLMEEKMSSELFLRGVNPKLFNLAAKQTGEEKTKTLALSRGLQTEAGAAGKAEHRNFLRGRAAQAMVPPTPAPAPAPATTTTQATAPAPTQSQELDWNYTQNMLERAQLNSTVPPEWFDEVSDEHGVVDPAKLEAKRQAVAQEQAAQKKKKSFFSRLFGR